jgi:hypothetical protein
MIHQIVVAQPLPTRRGELKHAHPRDPKPIAQLMNLSRDLPEVLRDEAP